MISRLFAILFVLFLTAGLPVLSWKSARPEKLRRVPRTALYWSAVLSEWLLGAAGVAAVAAGPWSLSRLGFRGTSPATFAGWAAILAVVTVAGLGLSILLEQCGWLPAESEVVYLLIPATRAEKLWAALAVSPTAGLCEEFLYRGFLMTELSGWFHSALWGLVISSLVFGLAHSYQGTSGVVRAAVLGGLLAFPVLRTGSLYPSMLAHALIDAVALLWLGPRFLKGHPEFAGGLPCDGK